MRELPILFNGPMVRAVLEGRKTQTRRPVKGWALKWLAQDHFTPEYVALPSNGASPYGYAGDQLWVRETWFREPHPSEFGLTYNDMPHTWAFACAKAGKHLYRADAGSEVAIDGRRWRPSIHMPRTASRITLEVTDVRVERLQDISEADAAAEGVEALDSTEDEDRDASDFDRQLCGNCGGLRLYASLGANLGVSFDTDCRECDSHAKRFRWLWEGINGSESWVANPWVWVVEFKRLEVDRG
ncbi:hypothetical protein [Lysobacter sp. Root96]|uniref:hypothetical protein n=1 Tax=Lysobacter sp. Root96 TaxID=1736612 RepID=UPI0006FF0EAA|nr:hypothetical protein [Lysobacter sp. Root96]KRD71392.1 hypothetical protein ASE45_06170 [Lysobacter sp. Root96]